MSPTALTTLRRAAPPALALAALLAAVPTLAAQPAWHEVIRGEDGTRVSIDSASITHTRDSTFMVRTAIHFPGPMQLEGGRTVDHEVDLEELDCGGGRSRGLVSGLYRDTAVVAAVAMSRAWAPVAENRRAVFDASCQWLLGSFAAALPTGYDLADVDEQPEIANRDGVARTLAAAYPRAFRTVGTGGTATVRFRITEQGTVDVRTVEVVQATHEDFALPALATVRSMRFRPARVQQAAVPVWVMLPVTFGVHESSFDLPRARDAAPR
jgi:TonB family protein